MKKIIALMLVLVMALSLAACGGEEAPEQTKAPASSQNQPEDSVKETEASQQTEASQAPAAESYTFTANGVKIAMNANTADFLAQLGEPKSYTEETSCAFEGLDKTYFFGNFYLQTYPQGEEDFVYCAWLIDDSLTTDEGIYIGATQAEVEAAYGAEGYNGSNAYLLTAGDAKLTIILTDGVVSSIQYDAIVD